VGGGLGIFGGFAQGAAQESGLSHVRFVCPAPARGPNGRTRWGKRGGKGSAECRMKSAE
jgi:hypothetical protein